MEQYNIFTGNSWSIENKANIDKDIELDKVSLNWKYPFGQFEIYKSKVNWILHAFPLTDEDIENCKGIDVLNNEAEFTHNNKTFKGTFIDALEYIKEEFKYE